MKQNDVHVLNWENFSSHTENKGILFEDLIEKLLGAMFPHEIWRRTCKSHDGKRDFVYPAEESLPEQKWAECKNYSNNVSLNVIAPTLVMGTIENIGCIFFFSYSSLNDNAVEGLLQYAKTSKKSIKIFDGNRLESLICKYHNTNGIADCFPNTDFSRAYAILKERKIRIIKVLKDMNDNKISPIHQFELGESFRIHIIIQNLILEQINYKISVKTNKECLLKYDNFTRNCYVPFAGIEEYSILCETLKPGNLECKIEITFDDIPKPIVKVERIKINDEPYLFWTGVNALRVLKRCKKHLLNNNICPLFISAEGGMGKSTLINILLQEEKIHKKYRTIKIDLNLTRNCSARNLFTQLVGLTRDDDIPQEQIPEDDNAFSILMDNYAESAQMIAKTIMKFYNPTRPFLFVMDDIQKIDRSYITLFSELNNMSKNENKPLYYILALNEDKCSMEEILSRLNWNITFEGINRKNVTLTKFDRNDITAFVKHKFGLQKIDKYFEDFDKKTRPLEVHSFCASLKKERIIAQIPNSKTYQIIDPFKFAENIKNILYNDISLKTICESFRDNIPEYVLKYLYITGKMNIEANQQYSKAINELLSLGIIKETGGTVVFYHDEMREYLGKVLDFSEEDYADIYTASGVDMVSKVLCALNQIGRIRNGSSFLNDFFLSGYEIQKKNQKFEICWLIFQNLNQLTKHALTPSALHFVKMNFATLNVEQGYSTFFCFLKHIADSALLEDWDIDSDSVENMAFFIKKFFDRALSTYNYHQCAEYFKKYKLVFDELKHISDDRRYFWLSHYANRTAIALDRLSVPLSEESHEITSMYNQSVESCEYADCHDELMLQILIDNFNRHYIYRHNMTKKIVQNTYNQLLDVKKDGLSESILLEYHLLLVEYLNHKMSNVKNDFIDIRIRVRSTRKKCQSAFYTLKLYMLEIYILIHCHCLSEANDLLEQAMNFAYKKEMRSYIYKLTYIKAHILIFQGIRITSPQVYSLLVLAFEQILHTRNNSTNDLKREIFLVAQLIQYLEDHDIICICRTSNLLRDDIYALVQELCKYGRGEYVCEAELFGMQSYFVFDGVSFPNI